MQQAGGKNVTAIVAIGNWVMSEQSGYWKAVFKLTLNMSF